MDFWIHDGFLDSWWVLGFKVLARSEGRAKRGPELLVPHISNMSSWEWIHEEIGYFWKVQNSLPRNLEILLPKKQVYLAHRMVFGQLVMPVQCCAEAPAAVPQHSTAQAWPTGQIPSSALGWCNVSWHQVFRLPEGWGDRCPEIWSSDM